NQSINRCHSSTLHPFPPSMTTRLCRTVQGLATHVCHCPATSSHIVMLYVRSVRSIPIYYKKTSGPGQEPPAGEGARSQQLYKPKTFKTSSATPPALAG